MFDGLIRILQEEGGGGMLPGGGEGEKHTLAYLHVEQKANKKRWMFDITPEHVLVIVVGCHLDVSPYYGNLWSGSSSPARS